MTIERASNLIHPTAIVDSRANLHESVSVGPYSIIGPGVSIGENSIVESHVVLKGPTDIGVGNHIYQFSSVGEDTPDLKYNGEPTKLFIGNNNVIREGVTIHRGTVQDSGETVIGNNNLLMAYVHVGHDSIIGNECILVNNAALAGHVVVDDFAILGGFTLVHQFSRIGAHSFTGMGSAIGKDVPAFMIVTGAPASARSVNAEGLKRRGFSKEQIARLLKAYKVVYRNGLTLEESISELEKDYEIHSEIATLVSSLKSSTRGILR